MDKKQQINHRQISWLTASILLTSSFFSLPTTLVRASKTDALFSQLVPLMFSLLICFFFYTLQKQYPDKNFFEITFLVAGKWGGAIINGILLLFMWTRLLAELSSITGFVNTSLLTRTPPEIVTLLFVSMLMYFGRSSIETIARVNDFFFPVFYLMLFGAFFLLINEFNLDRTEPFLSSGWSPVWKSNFIGVGAYGELFFMGAFLHAIPNSRLFYISIRHGVLLSALGLTLGIFLEIGVLGSTIIERMIYPSYMLVEQIHITDFLDRLEILLFSIWFPAFTVKVIIIFLSILIALSSYTNNRDYRLYSLPFGWFTLASSLVAFEGPEDVSEYMSYVVPVLILTIQLLFVLLVYGLSKWRKENKNSITEEEISIAKKGKKWGFCVYALLFLCMVSLVIGVRFGDENSIVGKIIAVFYGGCLFGATWFSYVELKKLK